MIEHPKNERKPVEKEEPYDYTNFTDIEPSSHLSLNNRYATLDDTSGDCELHSGNFPAKCSMSDEQCNSQDQQTDLNGKQDESGDTDSDSGDKLIALHDKPSNLSDEESDSSDELSNPFRVIGK